MGKAGARAFRERTGAALVKMSLGRGVPLEPVWLWSISPHRMLSVSLDAPAGAIRHYEETSLT